MRDEVQKHGKAIEAANQKKADVKIACQLFKTYIATEAKMLRIWKRTARRAARPPRSSSR